MASAISGREAPPPPSPSGLHAPARALARQHVHVQVEDVLARVPAVIPPDVHAGGTERVRHLPHHGLHGEEEAAHRAVGELRERRGTSRA